ncbi:MAG: HAD-IA family hydrolase [Planktomarina sp.]|nr:haloacid dehalogenase [Planktomarina sp.]MDT1987147.1 HAD-IA family hydrolase [Planktomarina sp.]MDT2018311.1 HAD-IA family hydrolase [Planktomarina sp.]MDV3050201.1 HAD-IA family hydrolase [Planktomarina sp.]
MLKPCVVFDLDGTLADTSNDLLNAANMCFRGLGLGDLLKHPFDSGIALQGGRKMLTVGFQRAAWSDMTEVDRQYPILLKAYASDIASHTKFYPGALAAVACLRKAGIAVAICTNKPEKLAIQLLEVLQAKTIFDAVVGADTLTVKKPNPEPFWAAVDRSGGDRAQCCLVGDTVTDHCTALNAGVPSILVTFGPGANDMVSLGPDALLENFLDLPNLVQNLFR